MTRRRSSGKVKVRYAEVESDVDISEDDLKVVVGDSVAFRRVGDKEGSDGGAYGSASKKKKQKKSKGKKAKTGVEEDSGGELAPLALFVSMPLDVFTEVMKYLDTRDLITLVKTVRMFRSLLLSRNSRSIWASKRIEKGIAKCADLDEVQFAILMTSSTCFICGCTSATERVWEFRQVLCSPCLKVSTIRYRFVQSRMPDIHPRSLSCVPFKPCDYRIVDLEEASLHLSELQQEDEAAQEEQQVLRIKAGTRSRRGMAAEPVRESISNVERFVQEKQKKFEAVYEESRVIRAKLAEIKAEEVRFAQEEKDELAVRQTARMDAIRQRATSDLGLDELNVTQHVFLAPLTTCSPDQLLHRIREVKFCLAASSASGEILTDEEWITLGPQVVKKVVSVLARVEKRRIEDEHRETRNARCRLVRLYIKKLPKPGSTIRRGVQPLLQDFYNFSTVKEKWIDPVSGTDIDDDAWNEHLPQVEVDLANFREEQRVLAIRRIIAAKEDTPIGRLCNLSATYPPRRYPPSFFAKLTSHDIFSIGHDEVKLVPYPLSHHWTKSLSGQFVRRPRIGVNRHTVITIRALLRAAGLESKTATIEDLEDVQRGGRSFVWRNDPVEVQRTVCRTWDKLVHRILRHCPWETVRVPSIRLVNANGTRVPVLKKGAASK